MVLELFVNFCILFTFAMLLYWFSQKKRALSFPFFYRNLPISVGILSGLFGTVLMLTSIHSDSSVIIDGRMAVLALSGLFGGPIAPVIAGVIIGSFRIILYDISTDAWIAGVNTVMIGVVLGVIARRVPITFQNAHYFFFYTTTQTALIIAFLTYASDGVYLHTALFLLYSIFSFAIVYTTLYKMKQLTEEIEKIEYVSVTDYLTGLPNSRKFQEISYIWMQTKDEFHLAIIDIDYFKQVNDQHGHPIGDIVLVELARRLERTSASFGGMVFRIGGEEFAVLLPASLREQAFTYAELLRKQIELSPFIISEDIQLPITVSIGVANYPRDAKTITELYKEADDELYKAKEFGRNQVSLTPERSNKELTSHLT